MATTFQKQKGASLYSSFYENIKASSNIKKIIFHQKFLLNTYLVGNAQSKWFVHQYFAGVTSIATTSTATTTTTDPTTTITTMISSTTKPNTTTTSATMASTTTMTTISAGIFHILTTIVSCNKLGILEKI